MNFKVFVVVFVGLLCVNVSFQSPTLRDDDLKVVVVDILNKVLNASTNALKTVNDAIDAAEKDQSGIKDRIVAFAVTVGKDVNAWILKAIDGLKDGATDDGKACVDCIEAEQEKTEAAFTTVFGNIGNCAAGEAPLVIAEVRKALGQLNDLVVDLQGQTDTLSACTDDDLVCLIALASSAIETVKKIPAVVQTDIQDIKDLVQTIISDVSGCAGEVVAEIKADAQDIFNEAVVCIKK